MKIQIQLFLLLVPLLIGCDNTNQPSARTPPSNPSYIDQLFYESRHEEAIAKAEEDLLRIERRYGDNSDEAARYLNALGNLYRECNRLSEAEKSIYASSGN